MVTTRIGSGRLPTRARTSPGRASMITTASHRPSSGERYHHLSASDDSPLDSSSATASSTVPTSPIRPPKTVSESPSAASVRLDVAQQLVVLVAADFHSLAPHLPAPSS